MKTALLPLMLAAGLSSGSAQAYDFTLTNLGLYTNNGARMLAVNNIGQMGGFSTVGLTSTRTAISSNGLPGITITNLHTQGGGLLGGASGSYAAGINEAGQVVGQALRTNWSAYVPFVASNGGTMTEINPLGGSYGGTARDINNAGQVVGGAYTAGNTANHAYLYNTGNGAVTDIGAQIAGSTTSEAFAVNDAGQVAGAYNTPGYAQRAFLYSNGSATDLGTFGGTNAKATGINDSGKVVGWSNTASNAKHAFLYSGGVMTDIGTLAGGHTEANGINNAGQIVGFSAAANIYGQAAFIYQNGVMTNLNSLIDPSSGWTLIDAYAISNTGYIVGSAINYNGTVGAAVILTPAALNPVPEPETWAMLLAGLGLVGFAVRRRLFLILPEIPMQAFSLCRAAVFTTLLSALVAPAHAALSSGNAIEVTYLYPNPSTVYAGPVTVTGATSLNSFAGILNIGFSDTSIVMTLTVNAGINGVAFDGLKFTDVNGSLPFNSLALDTAATNYAQFSASRISHQGSSIFINLVDLPGLAGQSIVISAVPEPETWAMLLAGLGLVGFAARRRATAIF